MTAKKKRYRFEYSELSLSKDEFVIQFVKKIVEEYKIPQKKLDRIYSDLVNAWNSD